MTYDRRFWLAYLANFTASLGVALLYRYADLVTYLGGSEFHLGWIVGIGMIGAIAVRPGLGRLVDRCGPHRVWWVSLATLAVSCLGHLVVASPSGPTIFLMRILYSASVAGIYGSSMTWISGRVPPARAAEVMGMLGSGGFLAMMLGCHLGDLLLGTQGIAWEPVSRMFVVASGFSLLALGLAYVAGRGSPRPAPRRRASLWRVIRRYNPGTLLLVGTATGMALGLPAAFLRPFAAELGTPRIGLFFSVYALTAVGTRVCTRRFPERLGLERMMLLGMGLLVVAMLLLAIVRQPWQLIVPALVLGIAHAIVFPPMVASGSQAFPTRYRGTGTMLILAACDVGTLVGAPLAGVILGGSQWLALPPYATMFATMAVLVGALGLIHARWRPAAAARPTGFHEPAPRRRRPARRRLPLPTPAGSVAPAASVGTTTPLPAPAFIELEPSRTQSGG